MEDYLKNELLDEPSVSDDPIQKIDCSPLKQISGWTRIRDAHQKKATPENEQINNPQRKNHIVRKGKPTQMKGSLYNLEEAKQKPKICRRSSASATANSSKFILKEPSAKDLKRITEKTECMIFKTLPANYGESDKTENSTYDFRQPNSIGTSLNPKIREKYSLNEQNKPKLLVKSKRDFFESTFFQQETIKSENPLKKFYLNSSFLKKPTILSQRTQRTSFL